ELAAARALRRARHVLQEPAELRAGEVRVDDQARVLADRRLVAVRLQALALRRRPPVLPHDGAVDGAPGAAVPEHDRLALVGDAERDDVLRADARAPARLAQHAERDAPDLLRVVLDPAGLRVVLPELGVRAPDDAPRAVEDEDRRPRGPLIDGDDARHGVASYPRKMERRRRRPSRMSPWRRSRAWSASRAAHSGRSASAGA